MDNPLSFFKEERVEFKNIFQRFKRADFRGNSGAAIKNSTYQLALNLVMKFGSLFFTIIITRMLLPEKFGLYTLALSTIVFFSAFSDLGIKSAVITFISKKLSEKNKAKAKDYFSKLLKWKFLLLILIAAILIASSYFIANYYYNKPIFYTLLIGGLYVFAFGFVSFMEQTFKATNDFKRPLIKEFIFQALRFILVPIAILLMVNNNYTPEMIVFGVLLTIIACYTLTLLYLLVSAKKKLYFLKEKGRSLNKNEIKELSKFTIPLAATSLSGVFFGYIDIFMLGRFVEESFIAFYSAAFSLAGSLAVIIGFTAIALFPVFARMKGKALEKIFERTRLFTFIISFLGAAFVFFFAPQVIHIVFGVEYAPSSTFLRYLSILVLILPTISLYFNYFISQKKTKIVAKLLIGSTIINIILNYLFIKYGLTFGMFEAVIGVCLATIISKCLYFAGLIFFHKKWK